MSDTTIDAGQTKEDTFSLFSGDVSDEALEAAGGRDNPAASGLTFWLTDPRDWCC